MLLLALGFLSGCYEPVEEVVVRGSNPIPRIVYFGPEIEVYPTIEWPALIHTELFHGFRPGMNFLDAVKSVGLPERRGRGPWGPFYEYQRPGGRVVVSFEEVGSGTAGAVYASWKLRAYPDAGALNELIDPVLRLRLNRDFRERTELVIMKPNGEYPALSMVVAKNRVESIVWLAE